MRTLFKRSGISHYLLDHVLDLRVEQEFFLGLVLLIVTDHYLLGPMLIISPKILEEGTLDPANNDKQPTIRHASGSPLYRWSFASCAESTDHRAQLVIWNAV